MYDIKTAGLLFNAASIPSGIYTRLCDEYGEFEPSESLFDKLGMTKSQKLRISSLLAKNDWADREIERINSFGAKFITIKDTDYPARLFRLKHPPVGLYVLGPLDLSLPSVAIVGTRHASTYGLETAWNLSRSLVRKGFTIISGGAKGIDAAGHKGALSTGGNTAAVFGTGLDRIYPVDHKKLFAEIAKRGALVSEYPFGTNGEGWRFIARNRIIAGIAQRVVVVESPEGGGALHTAKWGFEAGREVWAVPGRISDVVSLGSNKLLNEGAKVLVDIEDFAGGDGQLTLNFGGTAERSDDEKRVYSLIQRQGNRTLDDIAGELKMNAVDVSSALVNLEADGLILISGGRYSEAGSRGRTAGDMHSGARAIPQKDAVNSEAKSAHSDDEAKILSLLSEHSSLTLDEISHSLGDVTSTLIELEAEGLIVSAGGRYSRAGASHEKPSPSNEAKILSLLSEHSSLTLDEISHSLGDVTSTLIELEANGRVVNSGGRYSLAGAYSKKPSPKNDASHSISSDEAKILSLLSEHSSLTLDEISHSLGDVTTTLIELEANGRVVNSGGRYSLAEASHKKPSPKNDASYSISSNEAKILSLLSEHSSLTLDEISHSLGDVTTTLIELEAEGLIVSAGGRYSLAGASHKKTSPKNDVSHTISGDEANILSLLTKRPNLTLDEILHALTINSIDAVSALISLEAEELISSSGGRYSACPIAQK